MLKRQDMKGKEDRGLEKKEGERSSYILKTYRRSRGIEREEVSRFGPERGF